MQIVLHLMKIGFDISWQFAWYVKVYFVEKNIIDLSSAESVQREVKVDKAIRDQRFKGNDNYTTQARKTEIFSSD